MGMNMNYGRHLSERQGSPELTEASTYTYKRIIHLC